VFVMSYANLVFTRGVERFLLNCASAGARGVIVPDLPADYDEGLFAAAASAGLAAVPVVSPSVTAQRLSRIAALGGEYFYATLRSGTTGPRTVIDDSSLVFLARAAGLPGPRRPKVLAGFGISQRSQVEALEKHVHAVIVGSALVREVAKGGDVRTAVRRKLEELAGG
jgi:tryptophan synthase alpha chain